MTKTRCWLRFSLTEGEGRREEEEKEHPSDDIHLSFSPLPASGGQGERGQEGTLWYATR